MFGALGVSIAIFKKKKEKGIIFCPECEKLQKKIEIDLVIKEGEKLRLCPACGYHTHIK